MTFEVYLIGGGTLTLMRGLSIIRHRYSCEFRGIAQSGSAPALGAGCREFESLYPDQSFVDAEDW